MDWVQKGALNILLGLIVAGSVYYASNYIINEAKDNILPTPSNGSSLLDPNGPIVQFLLYTRKTVNNTPQYLLPNNSQSLEKSNFDSNLTVKIIIHGFLSGVNDEIFYILKDAYLTMGEYNIIGVDWSKLCAKDYLSAIKGTHVAADNLSSLINSLSTYKNVKLDDVHIIGHSLGAHVAGLTADRITTGKIDRITGLDPAGPGFKEAPEFARLDPGDAKIVDIIHTSTQVLSLTHPVGHVDFYPNGGKAQPGCPDLLKNPRDNMYCNHGRAYWLFAETIANQGAFKSFKCAAVNDAIVSRCLEETDVYMGQADTYKYGLYYVKTRAFPPFSYT